MKGTYWYFITYGECPVCGSGSTYRERRDGTRPVTWEDRHRYEDQYDGCVR